MKDLNERMKELGEYFNKGIEDGLSSVRDTEQIMKRALFKRYTTKICRLCDWYHKNKCEGRHARCKYYKDMVKK